MREREREKESLCVYISILDNLLPLTLHLKVEGGGGGGRDVGMYA